MEKKKSVVYKCPFCDGEVWFDKRHQLVFHLYKEHLGATLQAYADQCKEEARRTQKKWHIQQ